MTTSDSNTLRSRWRALPPKRRRWITVGIIGVVILWLLWEVASFDPTQRARERERQPQEMGNLFGRADSRGMTLTSLQQQLDELARQNAEAQRRLAAQDEELKALRISRDPTSPGAEGAVADQAQPRPRANAERFLQGREGSTGARPAPAARPARQPPPGRVAPVRASESAADGAPRTGGPRSGPAGRPAPPPPPPRAPQIRRLSEVETAAVAEQEPASTSDSSAGSDAAAGRGTGVFVPAGSIMTGILLAGVDAPTGRGTGTGDPIPILARVKEQAILPNRFRADVRECFIVGSAVGDLASERAYIRSEALSCVRADGGVIEVRLGMYGVGEDGKAGIRGRLVSKQAQVISRALLAGFADGMARAFQPQRIPVLATNGSGSAQFQDAFSGQAAQAGALGGMSSALERLAQFYIRLAEQMFPVIEVDANREISFVVTQGGELMLLDP